MNKQEDPPGGPTTAPSPLLPSQDEVADRLLDRLKDCTRAFESVLVLGGAGRQVAERLEREAPGTRHVTHVDTSQAMLDALARLHAASARSTPQTYVHWTDTRNETLPVAPGTYDGERVGRLLRAHLCWDASPDRKGMQCGAGRAVQSRPPFSPLPQLSLPAWDSTGSTMFP